MQWRLWLEWTFVLFKISGCFISFQNHKLYICTKKKNLNIHNTCILFLFSPLTVLMSFWVQSAVTLCRCVRWVRKRAILCSVSWHSGQRTAGWTACWFITWLLRRSISVWRNRQNGHCRIWMRENKQKYLQRYNNYILSLQYSVLLNYIRLWLFFLCTMYSDCIRYAVVLNGMHSY